MARALLCLLLLPLLGAAPPPRTLPVHFHVATVGEAPAVAHPWLDAQLASANAIFRPHGLVFIRAAVSPLPEANARLEDRADRDALGAFLKPGVINAFIVTSLRDIHDPGVLRQGVHWRPFRHRPDAKGRVRHQVIVAAYAGQTVLAHELGHFFGHPRHTKIRGNLMSYDRGDALPTLTARQGRGMRRFARRFLRSGELRAAEP